MYLNLQDVLRAISSVNDAVPFINFESLLSYLNDKRVGLSLITRPSAQKILSGTSEFLRNIPLGFLSDSWWDAKQEHLIENRDCAIMNANMFVEFFTTLLNNPIVEDKAISTIQKLQYQN